MRVRNKRCIRKLARRSLLAERKRNMITIAAIALTTLLFTAVFTVVLSMNKSSQEYTFRQLGGYSDGTFKEVSAEQIRAISAHPKVKQSGVRTVIGAVESGVFAKESAEVSFMDENCTKWSYALPSAGRMPADGNEITMDTGAMELLGLKRELNQKVTLTIEVGMGAPGTYQKTDTFTLVGYWDYDPVMPVHYINTSKAYAEAVEREAKEHGIAAFRSDLNVMMALPFHIRSQMEQVDRDLGYTFDDRGTEHSARIGVNWGKTSEQLIRNADAGTIAGILMILLVIAVTGYLIIYNIFQISVSNDIRQYGLLKTIGVTEKQLRRMVRLQAVPLCLVGIPLGLLAGYGVGAAAAWFILRSMSGSGMWGSALSISPAIFVGAAVFTFVTVRVSCMRPARIASKVSPVDAARYTEQSAGRRKRRRTHRIGPVQMAIANLHRKPGKTVIVLASLTFSLLLANGLYTFVAGFDMEKYLDKQSCADFVVSSTDYFHYQETQEYISDETLDEIRNNVEMQTAGCGYRMPFGTWAPKVWMKEENWKRLVTFRDSENSVNEIDNTAGQKDGLIAAYTQIEGLDPDLFEKLTVLNGNLDAVKEPDRHAVAVVIPTDDFGKPLGEEFYPKVGETLPVTYVRDGYYIDTRTGGLCDETTPEEYLEFRVKDEETIDYTVAAHVIRPYAMGFRYGLAGAGPELILSEEALRTDSVQPTVPMVFLFDTPNPDSEKAAEQFLGKLTTENENLMYESKDSLRQEFKKFRDMFLLVGGLLCAVIAVIGILNYFNVIMTSILSRKREFAILQAVGMTNSQLRKMLITEGLIYMLGAVVSAALLHLIVYPLLGRTMDSIFWFLSPHLTILPIAAAVPIFVLLGWGIPTLLYGRAVKESVIDRIREIEQ